MSRPRLLLKRTMFALRPIDWAFVAYYSAKYGKDRGEVLRRLIQGMVDNDKSFDVREFAKYVKDTLIHEEDDPDLKEQLSKQVKSYVDERGKPGTKKTGR